MNVLGAESLKLQRLILDLTLILKISRHIILFMISFSVSKLILRRDNLQCLKLSVQTTLEHFRLNVDVLNPGIVYQTTSDIQLLFTVSSVYLMAVILHRS